MLNITGKSVRCGLACTQTRNTIAQEANTRGGLRKEAIFYEAARIPENCALNDIA